MEGMFFLAALGTTLLIGLGARLVVYLVTVDLSPRIGGLCIATGFAVGRYSLTGTFDPTVPNAPWGALGAALALLALWKWSVPALPRARP